MYKQVQSERQSCNSRAGSIYLHTYNTGCAFDSSLLICDPAITVQMTHRCTHMLGLDCFQAVYIHGQNRRVPTCKMPKGGFLSSRQGQIDGCFKHLSPKATSASRGLPSQFFAFPPIFVSQPRDSGLQQQPVLVLWPPYPQRTGYNQISRRA